MINKKKISMINCSADYNKFGAHFAIAFEQINYVTLSFRSINFLSKYYI